MQLGVFGFVLGLDPLTLCYFVCSFLGLALLRKVLNAITVVKEILLKLNIIYDYCLFDSFRLFVVTNNFKI